MVTPTSPADLAVLREETWPVRSALQDFREDEDSFRDPLTSEGYCDLIDRMWSFIARQQAVIESLSAESAMEKLSELMRGLEIPPISGSLHPTQLYMIGKAIAEQAKRANESLSSSQVDHEMVHAALDAHKNYDGMRGPYGAMVATIEAALKERIQGDAVCPHCFALMRYSRCVDCGYREPGSPEYVNG